MFQEFPKWVYGPNGEAVVVANYEAELAQLAAWSGAEDDDEVPAEVAEDAPKKRGPGRPRKDAA